MKKVYLAIPELMGLENTNVWGAGAMPYPVKCVKAYRAASGAGLAESKEIIDRIIKRGGFIKEKHLIHVRAFKLTMSEWGIRWLRVDKLEVQVLQVHEA